VGEVGAEVGGAIWTPFLAAFVLAVFTAFAYAELVSKYPRAAGAALYTHKAFRAPFFTFIVAFAACPPASRRRARSRARSPATT
jgi:basic amino acid/polyamine antiporter, APA family